MFYGCCQTSVRFPPLFSVRGSRLILCRNDGTRGRKHPPRFFQFIHVVTLVCLILTIIAASEVGSTSPSTVSTSISLRKATSILFLVVVIGTTLLMLAYITQFNSVHHQDRILVTCTLLAAPFLLVRVIYTVLVAWENNATLNAYTPNIYVEAFMEYLMEFIVFALFATAGAIVPRIDKRDATYVGQGSELGKRGGSFGPGRQYDDSEQAYVRR
jgi:hypothetical protein